MIRRMVVDSVASAARGVDRVARSGAEMLERADLGVGPVRITPSAYRRLRAFMTAHVRDLLEVPHQSDVRTPRAEREPNADPRASLDVLLSRDDPEPPDPEDALRRRFAELLELSRDVDIPDGPHPAFAAILEQLTPDEARILVLFASAGPQPVVDLVSGPLIGRGDVVVAANLNLTGDRAGANRPDRAPEYLTNLVRLGLLRIDDDELPGDDDYELIEVDSDVTPLVEEIEEDRRQRAKFVRKSACLTDLGRSFVKVCVPEDALL